MPNQSQAMQLLTSNESVDWYTPPFYIELVRKALQGIYLDPASCAFANEWIKAKRIFTGKVNGLSQRWDNATVFCNPPYGKTDGKSNQAVWSQKMVSEYKDRSFACGILLVNSTHGYKWYEDLYNSYPSCLVYERIRFLNSKGESNGQAKRGQTFIYFGENESRFFEVFGAIGRCLPRNPDGRMK